MHSSDHDMYKTALAVPGFIRMKHLVSGFACFIYTVRCVSISLKNMGGRGGGGTDRGKVGMADTPCVHNPQSSILILLSYVRGCSKLLPS